MPGTIRSIVNGEPPEIRSDGLYTRDYFYVEDGALVYTLLAEKLAENRALAGEAFNFSNEHQITVLELVARIMELLESNFAPSIKGEASNEIRHQYLSGAKARRLLGWEPCYSLDEGLKRTIAWYRDFLGEVR